MGEISSESYPQKMSVPAGTAAPIGEKAYTERGPNFFKQAEAVLFQRVRRVLSYERVPAGVRMVCETTGALSSTTQTHETRMHQFVEQPEHHRTVVCDVTFWSATIFRVRFGHTTLSDAEPSFPDQAGRMLVGSAAPDLPLDITEDAAQIVLRTAQITLSIAREPFLLSATDAQGQIFWSQRRSDLFTADIYDTAIVSAAGRNGCFEAFTLAPQEAIYGLGERFDGVQRRGRPVDFWNQDAIGTSNRRTYINVPFLFSTRGYGLFLNSSYRTEWDVGVSEAGTLGFAVEHDMLDYFVIYGPSPAAILHGYSTLTGFAPTPPVWSFGLWMSRNSYQSWDVVEGVAAEMRRREIPTDVLHLDTAWFREDWNPDLRFSTERFPDPERHLADLRERGFRVSLWQYNFIPPRTDNEHYREARERGYLALGVDGQPFAYPPGTTGSWIDDVIIDFSNPAAGAWYAEKIRRLIRMGAATIKTDFGEGIPEDALYAGIEGRRFHNLYSLVYNSVVAGAVTEVSGEHIVWARSGTAGSQRYPIHWGGDSQCSWSALAGTLRGALSLGLSGIPFFSHDIGGFIGRPDPELYIRWAQFGLFSSHARCHGAGNENSREPWTFGEEAERIFRRYDQLRYRLLPYIYETARDSSVTGKPVVRALVIDYPQDRNVWHLDDQYLFGDALLIAPVLEPLADRRTRHIYLPAGVWFDYWTKQRLESPGGWIERPIDLETMPIYVKSGSVLPYTEIRQSTANVVGPIVHVEVYGDLAQPWRYSGDDGTLTVSRARALSLGGAASHVPTIDVYQ